MNRRVSLGSLVLLCALPAGAQTTGSITQQVACVDRIAITSFTATPAEHSAGATVSLKLTIKNVSSQSQSVSWTITNNGSSVASETVSIASGSSASSSKSFQTGSASKNKLTATAALQGGLSDCASNNTAYAQTVVPQPPSCSTGTLVVDASSTTDKCMVEAKCSSGSYVYKTDAAFNSDACKSQTDSVAPICGSGGVSVRAGHDMCDSSTKLSCPSGYVLSVRSGADVCTPSS
jgi:hypothetical protein